jgi:hypothetical protein
MPWKGVRCGARREIPSVSLEQRNRRGSADFVVKVEKSRPTKTREIAIRRNIAARRHLSPVADLARCLIVKLAGPPANFLNAASLGLPEIEHRRKGSFSTKSAESNRSMGQVRSGRAAQITDAAMQRDSK